MNYPEMVEKLARNMALAAGCDPDVRVTSQQPVYMSPLAWRVVEAPDALGVYPLWMVFRASAESALQTLRGMTIPDDLWANEAGKIESPDLDPVEAIENRVGEEAEHIAHEVESMNGRRAELKNWRERQGL